LRKRKMKFSGIGIFILTMMLYFVSEIFVSAQGDLLITPRRIVFEGSKRSIDLNLANSGKDSATYAISLVQMRMTEEGQFEKITEADPGQNFADKNLRYFPRSVKLAPGEAQTVKVQVYRPNQLEPGEYRSHFYFRAVQDEKPLGETVAAVDSNTISVILRPVFGITIPVIIRVGEPTTRLTITDLNTGMFNDTIPVLSMVFNRTGNMSAYGDLAVYHVSPQGMETKVGIANGIAVYTPNTRRKVQVGLNRAVDYRSGKLRVTFSAPSDVKPVKYAEAELALR
jgi:uncharacterized membrane protein